MTNDERRATAWCPKCGKEIGQMAALCPHCGYDFPSMALASEERKGIAYSRLADVALTVGQVAAALACVLALAGGIVSLWSLKWLDLLTCAILFFVHLAVFVVFVRVQDMGGKGEH